MLGKVLFDLEMFKAADAQHRQGRFWRYPNMGWWYVHAAAMSAAFLVGYYLWQ
jgi:hypothetical protein